MKESMEFNFSQGAMDIEDFIKWAESIKEHGYEEITIDGKVTAK